MKRIYLFSILAVVFCIAALAHAQDRAALESLSPDEVLSKLNLDYLGLESVKAYAEKGERQKAFEELLSYYREQYPIPPESETSQTDEFPVANHIANHIFQWGPYEPADYGDKINWEWDPRGDIEWVAAIYRFYWARPLAEAYKATRNEKYAQAFVELTADWIAKHPLEKHRKTHSVYKHWRGYAWLDIQTGIRAQNICRAFKVIIHAESFTPDFLAILLASMYDHQLKTEKIPMGKVHNKAVFEQRGVVSIASTFPEFKDSKRWMKFALKRTEETFLAQTTTDGVQREWSGGYHLGVLRDAVEIMERVEKFGISVSEQYLKRIRGMYDYIFAMTTPDLGFPMFGDTSRAIELGDDRSHWPLYPTLIEASEILEDPKYAARAKLDRSDLPKQTSYAFEQAGMYVLRDQWGADQIYFALHCSPPAISSHDQPDNGTFELYAYGRWLMPDTGYYTYGHDPQGRAWHRRTRVHQTLTLDGKDTKVAAKHLFHNYANACDTLVVENQSYENLKHRRTVWFVNKQFFILLDEAIGNAKGGLDLHFQLAPGNAKIITENKSVHTLFNDVNVLISGQNKDIALKEEEGWFAWKYGKRKKRQAFHFHHKENAPAYFLTVIVPYEGNQSPSVSAEFKTDFKVGDNSVEVSVNKDNEEWTIGRDIKQKKAWCEINKN